MSDLPPEIDDYLRQVEYEAELEMIGGFLSGYRKEEITSDDIGEFLRFLISKAEEEEEVNQQKTEMLNVLLEMKDSIDYPNMEKMLDTVEEFEEEVNNEN